jgi:hypothetical protein
MRALAMRPLAILDFGLFALDLTHCALLQKPPLFLCCRPARRHTMRCDAWLDYIWVRADMSAVCGILCGPSLCGPSLCGPWLCGPSLCGPSLCGPSLCGPLLCGPSLFWTVCPRFDPLCTTAKASSFLCCRPARRHTMRCDAWFDYIWVGADMSAVCIILCGP